FFGNSVWQREGVLYKIDCAYYDRGRKDLVFEVTRLGVRQRTCVVVLDFIDRSCALDRCRVLSINHERRADGFALDELLILLQLREGHALKWDPDVRGERF